MLEMSDLTEKQIAGFWSKVRRGSPTECWNWTAGRATNGYGSFQIRKHPHYRTFRAHRLAYYLTHGAIDEDLVVMHSCDNRACCNPAHLSQGTQRENLADMWRRGRGKLVRIRGEGHYLSKLTDEAVRLIRQSTEPGKVLGQRFGVTPEVANSVRRRAAWKHVT